jgi:hypothetical protein
MATEPANPLAGVAMLNHSQLGQYFLLVLMWPAIPQLAHLRVVPVGFSTEGAGVDEGERALSGSMVEARAMLPFFCFSRAWRRSRFRSRRASSFLTL